MTQWIRPAGTLAAALSLTVMAAPAQAQLGNLFRSRPDPAPERTDDGCAEGESRSGGSRVLGGILGGIAGDLARDAGVPVYVPVDEFTDQITASIACKLDPEEQEQAAEATLEATRGSGESGPQVGSTASWTSNTRDNVSGTSTVTAREDAGEDLDCITVTDVVIVDGEETRANKRMCRPPGSARYSIVA